MVTSAERTGSGVSANPTEHDVSAARGQARPLFTLLQCRRGVFGCAQGVAPPTLASARTETEEAMSGSAVLAGAPVLSVAELAVTDDLHTS